jgi:3-deoxy-7-phosphoheptulonate synthase
MILFLRKDARLEQIEQLRKKMSFMGLESKLEIDDNHPVIAITGGLDDSICSDLFNNLPLVEKVSEFNHKFKLASKDIKTSKTVITIKNVIIGGDEIVVMAGPCSIESKSQIFAIAEQVSKSGAKILRGGAFKPRTSPYDFQGLGEEGLQYLRQAADKYGLLCISEVMGTDDIELVENYVDIIQLGARNMQNYSLLKAVGKTSKPILLKRGLSATYSEFLSAAEYIMSSGNPNVILCERGIRTFETYSRNTLDIAAVPILRQLTHLPIVVDPSHGVGIRAVVPTMANAAVAVSADGLIIEVHTHPDQSISDAAQTISTASFDTMMPALRKIATAVGREIHSSHAVEKNDLNI